mmetsp:Transcript_7629/g.21211  ORF Transcript_7629/g.21211 Transcript_7629/m.21211 type:complete len:207 (-) Transcript_7629:742-1362(-)
MTRKEGEQKGQNLVHGCPQRLEKEQEGHQGGCELRKSKSRVQFRRAKGQREKVKGGSKVHLRDPKVAECVSQFPVSQLVSQNGENFVFLDLFQQGIEQDDATVASKPKHERIGMSTAFGSIHDKQFGQRVFELPREFKDPGFERSFRERFVFVKERHNDRGHNGHHKQGEAKEKDPYVEIELVSTGLDNPQQQRHKGASNNKREGQ